MMKHLFSFIVIALSFDGNSQGQCYNCLVFQGTSVSIDSTISEPHLPRVFNASQYRNLSDGFWTSLFSENEVYIIFEIKKGELNGRVIRFAFPQSTSNMENIDQFDEFTFSNGKANGEFISWGSYSKKQVSERGNYIDNLKDSLWVNYYAEFANYAVYAKEWYKNGELQGTQKYGYPNGQLKTEQEYINGIPCGKETSYFSNGQKYLERIYYHDSEKEFITDNFEYINSFDRNGNPLVVKGKGTHKIFDENGQVLKSGKVENGKREGEWKIYSSNGRFYSIETYENGN